MSESAVPGHPAPLTRRQIREAERAREAAEAAERERQAAERERRAAEQTRQAADQARPAVRAEAREPETAQTLRRHLRAAAPTVATTAVAVAPAEVPAPTSTAVTEGAATPAPSAGTSVPAWASRTQEAALALGAPVPAGTLSAPAAGSSRRDATDTEVLPTQERLLSRRDLRHASGPQPARRSVQHAPRAAAGSAHGRSWAPRAAVLGAMGTLTIVAPLTGFAATDAERAEAAAVVAPETSILDVLEPTAAAAAVAPMPASLLKDPAASSRATVLQTSRAADRNALTCAPLDGASGARAAVTERTEQLVRPVADGTYRNSSHYGNRSHPLSGAYGFHTGTDYAAPLGTPIYAIANGTVEYVGIGKDGRSSMLVILRHEIAGQTVYSWYVHMYKDGIHVTQGQEVTAGDVIAEVGNNGNSTGPHLHFEIHLDDQGTTTDPLPWLEKQGAVEVSAVC